MEIPVDGSGHPHMGAVEKIASPKAACKDSNQPKSSNKQQQTRKNKCSLE